MPRTVFLSWQSDRPNAVGRTMIEASLAEAIKALDSDAEIRPADRDIAIDRDTLGVPGTPAIADTIYRKIAAGRPSSCPLSKSRTWSG